ncbi:hypothetical protein [Microbulbifer rhizosphaerae]|uniref:Outer membrane protein beta-barrel domain-containing protein n=1 Tax=Microbulbifer rhizosphaerae TaxID=1562603 RepID=A0A7W4Z8K6_9GAMM|nr:hypothetical protein [Microbulbifer rhizosphaerae]MBB3060687.1 hypothetical protein [Microbulbifer rhizosphaerae]
MKFKSITAAAIAAAMLSPVALAKPEGFYAGLHAGGVDSTPSASGPGFNLGYQGNGGWGVHAEYTNDNIGGFGGVFGTYRTSGSVYFLFKGGVAGGRYANGLAGGLGAGLNLGPSLNLEADANRYGDENVAHLRLSYSF